jgi:hypothetical protein
MAKILFHECIHILIFFGKTLPSGFRQTNIFLEFEELLRFANSKELCPEGDKVQLNLRNLIELVPNLSGKPQEKLNQVSELYEFLIHEKYSIRKTDSVFGLACSNRKASIDYAKLLALKMGFCAEPTEKIWKKENFKLCMHLNRLYDRIDERYKIINKNVQHGNP